MHQFNCQLTAKLKPLHPPVNAVDQPAYALAKKAKWMQPERFNECVIMLRHLHIKMAFLVAIRDWLKSSGWTTVFERAQISTVGCTGSFFSGLKVKRSRQAHQVSLDGGVTQLLENENTLLKWAVASRIISNMLEQSEEYRNRSVKWKHHEDTKSFEERFLKDRKYFLTAFLQLKNPFLEEDYLVHILSKHVLGNASSESIKSANEIGKQQYEAFVTKRLKTGSTSWYDNIKKKNPTLFRSKTILLHQRPSRKSSS